VQQTLAESAKFLLREFATEISHELFSQGKNYLTSREEFAKRVRKGGFRCIDSSKKLTLMSLMRPQVLRKWYL